ncbi:MAG: hypothetical protein ABJG88_11140 [Litorimonas sp.]
MNKIVRNTLSGRKRRDGAGLSFLFNPTTIITLVLIGIFSFAALIALSGYAQDLRKDKSGSPTPRSLSAVGYAGYVQLLKNMNYDVTLSPNLAAPKRRWETRPLRIYTLPNTYQSETLKDLPQKEAKLIVLPKWATAPKRKAPGWVDKRRKNSVTPNTSLSKLLNDAGLDLAITHTEAEDSGEEYKLEFSALNMPNAESDDQVTETTSLNSNVYVIDSQFDQLQSFDLTDTKLDPEIILTADGRPILIHLEDTQTYILSEPDVINTHGISTQSRARLAVDMLDVIAAYEGLERHAVIFDLSVHGLGGGRNIIKLMTQPPFLAATLCLLAAGGIITWQAFSRFGDPLALKPDFAQGPVSLAKSAAEFMTVSNRVGHMAPDYAQLTRQQIIRNMGLIGQSQDYIDRAIHTREKQREINPNFAQISETQDTENLIEHARALTRWKEEMMS